MQSGNDPHNAPPYLPTYNDQSSDDPQFVDALGARDPRDPRYLPSHFPALQLPSEHLRTPYHYSDRTEATSPAVPPSFDNHTYRPLQSTPTVPIDPRLSGAPAYNEGYATQLDYSPSQQRGDYNWQGVHPRPVDAHPDPYLQRISLTQEYYQRASNDYPESYPREQARSSYLSRPSNSYSSRSNTPFSDGQRVPLRPSVAQSFLDTTSPSVQHYLTLPQPVPSIQPSTPSRPTIRIPPRPAGFRSPVIDPVSNTRPAEIVQPSVVPQSGSNAVSGHDSNSVDSTGITSMARTRSGQADHDNDYEEDDAEGSSEVSNSFVDDEGRDDDSDYDNRQPRRNVKKGKSNNHNGGSRPPRAAAKATPVRNPIRHSSRVESKALKQKEEAKQKQPQREQSSRTARYHTRAQGAAVPVVENGGRRPPKLGRIHSLTPKEEENTGIERISQHGRRSRQKRSNLCESSSEESDAEGVDARQPADGMDVDGDAQAPSQFDANAPPNPAVSGTPVHELFTTDDNVEHVASALEGGEHLAKVDGQLENGEHNGKDHSEQESDMPYQLRHRPQKPKQTRRERQQRNDPEYRPTSSDAGMDATFSGDEDVDDDLLDHLSESDELPQAPRLRRQTRRPDYTIPPALDDVELAQLEKNKERQQRRARGGGKGKARSADPAVLKRWIESFPGGGISRAGATGLRGLQGPYPDSDSDSDHGVKAPQPPLGGAFGSSVAAGGGGLLPGDATVSSHLGMGAGGFVGTNGANLGKVGDAALADVDPLGVNQNVTFDEVGGLDDHIHSLKEMTLLPLLYPEVFQEFGIIPPRGVLFHGPPGTGKTLLARALAASCRSNGRSISFFMRKGADCLSKWVGEAERQLRLLFEEAKAVQPSIIFFDEIDGLAPVRSSKQDQIHASIVSTLLALMDGMDGRGQVVVVGATNRPDAVDPALRRPGRFDREFYFGLPNEDARKRILGIMTRKWRGWGWDGRCRPSEPPVLSNVAEDISLPVMDDDNPALKENESAEPTQQGQEKIEALAKLTKGYGGADLRALCTEAALNAIQRRYPQIYKSNDRLLLNPETINVGIKDFAIAMKRLIPSSARASSSAASPLPPQLVPLLGHALNALKDIIGRVSPVERKTTALEEAEYETEEEDYPGGIGLDFRSRDEQVTREMMRQTTQTLRVYRPRVIVHGAVGMGQGFVGAAVLHHLEGYNIQSLELGNLLSDSTRTVEAAIVQQFVEAKRHQPSVIYIPSLVGWCAAVSETSRKTVGAMLDTLSPTDPILLLAIVDGPFSEISKDVKAWFGPSKANRVELGRPTVMQRAQFFASLMEDIQREPIKWADGVKRKKRVLEELPLAPPLEPRKLTSAEIVAQLENDGRVLTMLKYRLEPILANLKRKFKRFVKNAREEYEYDFDVHATVASTSAATALVQVETNPDGAIEIVQEQTVVTQNGAASTSTPMDNVEASTSAPQPPPGPQPEHRLVDVDLEKMHSDLYQGKYLTPQDFLDDIAKIVRNAALRHDEDPDRFHKAQALYVAAEVEIDQIDPGFKLEASRMAVRERKRREEQQRIRDQRQKEKEERRRQEEERRRQEEKENEPRRSTRHNGGLQADFRITDPVKLERSLKRQRSSVEADEGSAARSGSHPSSTDEIMDADGGREPKRVKMTTPGDVSDDELNLRSSIPPLEKQLPPLEDGVRGIDHATSVDHLSNDVSICITGNGANHTTGSTPMDVDASNGITAKKPVSTAPIPSAVLPGDDSASNAGAVVASEKSPSQPEPMVIERTPSPPRPEFVVDPDRLEQLSKSLRDDTEYLTIEQLEQLRAMCLSTIWRHRREWDRTALLERLKNTVRDFVQEAQDCDWDE